LKNDVATNPAVADVEQMITASPELSLCADLCNGSKHMVLTRARSSADTTIGRKHVSLGLFTSVGGTGSDRPKPRADEVEG